LKEMSKTLIFLQKRGLDDYDLLSQKCDDISAAHNIRSNRIKEIEAKQKEMSDLQKHMGTYSKTKDIYTTYRKLKNEPNTAWGKFTNAQHPSDEFYEAHRASITLHEAAKKHFDAQGYGRGTGKKLPAMQTLKAEYAKLESEKKKLWSCHRAERDEMIALRTAKMNVDMFLGEPKQQSKTKSYEHSR